MNSIIQDLFNGKVTPYEKLHENNNGIERLQKGISKTSEELAALLSPDALMKHDVLKDLTDTLTDMENTECFARGFRLGTLLMVEVFYNKEDWGDIKDLLSVSK